MNAAVVPAHSVALSRQVHVFNEAFRGYIGGFSPLDLPSLSRLLASQAVDLSLSRFAVLENSEAGFTYVNRTGGVVRIAGMGVVPSARGKGVGRRLLTDVLAEARLRGDRLVTLEVFEENAPARALYESLGFKRVDRLTGWRRAAGESSAVAMAPAPPKRPRAAPCEEVDLLTALQLPTRCDYPVLPWQASRFGLAPTLPRTCAWTRDGARWIVSDPAAPNLVVRSILPGTDGEPAPALLTIGEHLLRLLPGRHWHAPAYLPEDLGQAVFAPLGFQQERLAQWFMHCPLAHR